MSKYEFASQSAILFSNFLDNIHINQLTNYVNELTILFLGGRLNLQYDAEISLLSSFIFYFTSLTCMNKTLGQSFCDFSLIKVSNKNDSLNQSDRIIVSKLRVSDRILLSVLYSLFPYIVKRKLSIYKHALVILNILKNDNTIDDHPINRIEGTNAIEQQPTLENDTRSESLHESIITEDQTSEVIVMNDSILLKLYRALKSSLSALGSTDESKMNNIETISQDVHRFLFLLNGQYFEFALQVLKIRYITTSTSKFNISLKPLAWLLGLRLALLSYYASRIILTEVDRELQPQYSTDSINTEGYDSIVKNSDIDSRDDIRSMCKSNNDSGSSSTSVAAAVIEEKKVIASSIVASRSSHLSTLSQCSLCIDKIIAPTVIPCGHLFCWSCLLAYTNHHRVISSSSTQQAIEEEQQWDNRTNGLQGNKEICKCPICRYEFYIQKIRLLHNH